MPALWWQQVWVHWLSWLRRLPLIQRAVTSPRSRSPTVLLLPGSPLPRWPLPSLLLQASAQQP